MSQQDKATTMTDFTFRMMVWFMRLEDLFKNPAELLKKIPLHPGMTVVDYACGPGRYTIPVAELVGPSGKVYAVDVHHLAVEITQREAQRRSLTNVETVLVNSFDTGMPDSVADVVLLIDALALIDNYDALFKEIFRLMKPGGLLFIDPTHMSAETGRNIVASTGLFTEATHEGRTMLLNKRLPS
jgi:ubiquinone/menaquinone biosynthesis C-methylase UbiE